MFIPEDLDRPRRYVRLTRHEFDRLGEYSCSLPTGTTAGKRWKRDANAYRRPETFHLHAFDGTPEPSFRGPDWWMGEYVEDPAAALNRDGSPKTVLIVWSKIVVPEL